MWQKETISSLHSQSRISDLLELGGVSGVICLAQLPTWAKIPCKYAISDMLQSSGSLQQTPVSAVHFHGQGAHPQVTAEQSQTTGNNLLVSSQGFG